MLRVYTVARGTTRPETLLLTNLRAGQGSFCGQKRHGLVVPGAVQRNTPVYGTATGDTYF